MRSSNRQFNHLIDQPVTVILAIVLPIDDLLQHPDHFGISRLLYSDVETIFKTVTGRNYKIKNRNASYTSGDNTLFEFITGNLRYPISARTRRQLRRVSSVAIRFIKRIGMKR